MDYEEMWNKLKEYINSLCEMGYDDIPQYIYESIQDKMNDIESQHGGIKHGDYVCIKNYGWAVTEGTECFIITETEDCYIIETCDGSVSNISKGKFDEYFQLIR